MKISSGGTHHRENNDELQTKITSRYKPTRLISALRVTKRAMLRPTGKKLGCLKPVQVLAFVLRLQT